MKAPRSATFILLGLLSLVLLATTPGISSAQTGSDTGSGVGSMHPAPMDDSGAGATFISHRSWLDVGGFTSAFQFLPVHPFGAWVLLPRPMSPAARTIETPAWRPAAPGFLVDRRAAGAPR